jgi:hypothetical protein
LRQARETDPPRPSSILPGLNRDVETVVLKCLEKEPGRRYGSAEALADDLSNWLSGRPISARPVGQAERFWRWCKRNPVVSGLTTAVAASLAIGIIVSTFFAVQASRRALAESHERARALKAEKNMEGLLARGLAKPLDPNADGNQTLSIPEAEALWELARLGDTDIGLRFLDEATRDPITVGQLGARSEPAIIASVGLDAARRDQAARLLTERLGDPGLRLQSKVDLAFVALELEDRASPQTEKQCGFLLQGVAGDFPDQLRAWRKRLIEVSKRIEPSVGARALAEALETRMDAGARPSLASALSDVAARMEPAEAVRICGRAAKTLADALDHQTGAYARSSLASALSQVAARMEPTQAARIYGQAAKTLADALARETDANAHWSRARALSKMAVQMEPVEAARVCGNAMRSLIQKRAAMDPATAAFVTDISVPELMRYLDPARVKAVTCEKAKQVLSRRDVNESTWAEILVDTSTAEVSRHASLVTMMIGQALSGQFSGAGALAAEPFPCRLTTQEMVELLKMPTCFGPARRVVLDHLSNRYGRRFANHWAFVRYAMEQGLDLDFTTPPRRPDPKESVERMLKVLDPGTAGP